MKKGAWRLFAGEREEAIVNKKIRDLADACLEDARAGRDQTKKSNIVSLLEVDPTSDDALYIRECANKLTREVTQCRGWVTFSIGVDFVPCKGNCRFCSFGEKWGIINEKNQYVFTHEQVVETARNHLAQGADGIVLRTTEFYPHDDLVALTRRVRKEIPGNYTIAINTGELSLKDCNDFAEAGANSLTHMLRLREGIDTGIDPEIRLRTIENIKASPLRWGCCIDPIGPEHSAEEIADLFLKYHELGNPGCGTMRRTNVPGTPLGDTEGQLTEEQCLLYSAALRICAGNARSGGCHPNFEAGLYSGISGFCVETGAVPRTDGFVFEEWPDNKIPDAIAMMEKAGFTMPNVATATDRPSCCG